MKRNTPILHFLCTILLFALDANAQVASLSPHGEIDLPVDCAACHRTEGWTPLLSELDFDHNRQTRFVLTGSHINTKCNFCHIENRFDEPDVSVNECAACHLDVHQGAFSVNCVDCHNTSLFQDVEGTGVHTRTNFPLTGAHAQITCISCHVDDSNGAFTLLESACVDCHEEAYNTSLLVDHEAAGFSQQCELCHTDLQWKGAIFEHLTASNGFDLIGAHAGLACASCHEPPDLASIFQPANDQDCISCHRDDYEAEHGGSGIQVTCLDCHNQNDWDDADFDHDARFFPIYSGEHRGTWDNCQTCHLQPETFTVFSCEGACHKHTESKMNSEHRGISSYVFESAACLNCHPDGDE